MQGNYLMEDDKGYEWLHYRWDAGDRDAERSETVTVTQDGLLGRTTVIFARMVWRSSL